MTDKTELKRLAEAAPGGPWVSENDSLYFKDGGYTRHLLDSDAGHDVEPEAYYAALKFIAAANPAAVLALIAENQALKGPHDWLAEDLIKELVDNAQAIQENADDGEEDEFVIVLLAAAQRIRRQEANIEKLKADVVLSAKAADCWDRLNIQNKALSDSFRNERDRLRAEVADLRTGYEAYEQVNAELKAEVELLESSRAKLAGELSRLRAKHKDWSVIAALGQGEQS